MTPPPSPLLKNCPKEIQDDPLPFDECSTEVPDWRKAGERYQQLTVYLEAGGMELFDRGFLWRPGFGAVYRPTRILGLGAQINTVLEGWEVTELDAFAKLDLSLNIDHEAKHRATFSVFSGIHSVFGKMLPVAGAGPGQEVSGNRFLTGAEFAWDIRVFKLPPPVLEYNPVLEYITLSPFLAFYYTPEASLSLSADESRQVQVQDQVRILFGIRLGLEMFNVGNQPAPPP